MDPSGTAGIETPEKPSYGLLGNRASSAPISGVTCSSPRKYKGALPQRKVGQIFNSTFEGFAIPPVIQIELDNFGFPAFVHIKASVKVAKDLQTIHSIIDHLINSKVLVKYHHKKLLDVSLDYVIPYMDFSEVQRDTYKKYYCLLRRLEAGENPKQVKDKVWYSRI